jgi:ribosomal protein S18 acetylase RimI-like enzyme
VLPEQFKEAVEFFNDHFLAHEPSTISGSRGSNHLQSDVDKVDELVLDFLKYNLSWCAVDADTGKIVGLSVAHSQSLTDSPDRSTPPTSDKYVEGGFSRHFACMLAMLDLMLDYKKILTSYQVSKALEVFAVGVHSEYRNKGIAAELVR